jgi:predicted HAD superfamily phosphohydrolase YqeG
MKMQAGGRPNGKSNKISQYGMLGPQPDKSRGLKTLVLDLDETLVHSQF